MPSTVTSTMTDDELAAWEWAMYELASSPDARPLKLGRRVPKEWRVIDEAVRGAATWKGDE